MGEGQPDYTEFLLGEESIAGAWEMNPMVPAESESFVRRHRVFRVGSSKPPERPEKRDDVCVLVPYRA